MRQTLVLALLIITGIIFFLLGLKISHTSINPHPLPSVSVSATTIQDEFPLLGKRISFVADKDRIIHFVPLRNDLNNFITKQTGFISVYFEYIPTGNSIGINSQEPIGLASLLKIPVVMAIKNKENNNKIHQNDTVNLTEAMIDKNYGTLWQKGIGYPVSIEEAIRLSLQESDNTAHQLLRLQLTPQELAEVYDSLDIPLLIKDNEPAVTAKNYTSILKSLYFASYLPLKDSEEILDLLSQSSFTEGIKKPIPEHIRVAHKMGIREEENILSDCGVIYIPNRPYFLCILTRDVPKESQTMILQTISQLIFDYLSNK